MEEFKGRDTAFVSDWVTRKVFKSWGQTDISYDRVGHLNTVLARGGGNLNDAIFKISNALGLLGVGVGDVEVSSLSVHNRSAKQCHLDTLFNEFKIFGLRQSCEPSGSAVSGSIVVKMMKLYDVCKTAI